jgi:hypothetical protein
MKKLLLVFALVLLPLSAFAEEQRAVLLTSDGTLFVAEQESPTDSGEVGSSVRGFIRLTIRRGEETQKFIVPGTRESGLHKNPALAFDDEAQTLFVFWQRSESLLHSELVFQSLSSDFHWGPTASFGDGSNYRENLRIAVTRKADSPDGTGIVSIPQINVHAVWWESDSWDGQESAQYAMLTIEKGTVVAMTVQPLFEFVDSTSVLSRFVAESVPEVFKHPSLFPSPQQDSVLVLFGELRNDSMNRVRIRPGKIVGNARVHIPVGRSEGGTTAPRFNAASNSHVGSMIGGDDRIALYTTDEGRLNYVLFKDGKWGQNLTVQLDGTITSDVAINAVRRLIENEH